jgi:hypothetical protein
MRTILIDDESVDKLMQDVLSSDYLELIDNVRSMEEKIKNNEELEQYQMEDLKNWVKTISAIDILFDWYMTSSDAEQIRNQGRS